ncbi:Transcriptional activator protein DAL81 [Wickerhamiella sorbophila]|uniref:Transcriptional activator protein DAL81 n=1 Tax=Wickerhamiella sorbophila TaxID=45607 RepID=A0A2T0FCD9_9ASCO|nr:Transcriptional activator protein DAL81 [Wickerhamiella sorbophila]PRT52673.1 Transcriptional activator protein DAL81 [Wickerhamiella sorbophila]
MEPYTSRIEVKPLEAPQRSEKGPSFIPPDYSGAALIGVSADQDPYLVQFYKRGPDNVSRFVDQGIHLVEKSADPYKSAATPVAFSVFRKPQASAQSKYLTLDKSRVDLAVDPYRERLLALYFKFIDWTYPAVDKHTFYQNYYFKKDQMHTGLLSGMLAIACIYWKYDSQLCVKQMPKALAAQLWEQCALCIDGDILAPTLETVQALLLYLQRRLARGDTNEQHAQAVWLGKLVAVAHSLGLHLDCTNWAVSDHEKQVRRRLWALTVFNDKLMSLVLGRPSLLHPSRSSARPFDSIHPQEQLFVQLCKLTQIVSGVIDDLYSPERRYDPNYDSSSLEVVRTVESYLQALDTWNSQLPHDMSTMQGQPDGYCRNGVLHLLALTVEVDLWRVLLVPSNMNHPDFGYWRTGARSTIQKIIVYTSEITYSHLHAFWPATCPQAFSTLAHFVFYYYVQSSAAEQQELTDSLRRWLWALRVLANTWPDGTGLATLRMDAVFHMGKTNVQIPPPPPQSQPKPQPQSLPQRQPELQPRPTFSPSPGGSDTSPLSAQGSLHGSVNGHPPHPAQPPHQHAQTLSERASFYSQSAPTPFYDSMLELDPLVNHEIIPLEDQRPGFAHQEYYETQDPTIYENISLDDLVKDSLHDLLMKNIFDEHYQ